MIQTHLFLLPRGILSDILYVHNYSQSSKIVQKAFCLFFPVSRAKIISNCYIFTCLKATSLLINVQLFWLEIVVAAARCFLPRDMR